MISVSLYPLNIPHILCNIPFLNFMSNSLSPVRVTHMCMRVGPSTGAWETMSIRVLQRYIYLICLCLCTTLWLVPTEPREGTGSPEIGVIDVSQLAHWCWESNLYPLKSSQFSYCWLKSPAAPCSFLKVDYRNPPNTAMSLFHLSDLLLINCLMNFSV